MKKDVRIGVSMMLVKDNKVLFGKRIGSHGEGTWSTPGGHLDFGESPEECALRELQEETGLIHVDNLRIATMTNDIFEKEEKHYVTLYIVGNWIKGEPIINEPDKCTKWEWYNWDKLPSPPISANSKSPQTRF